MRLLEYQKVGLEDLKNYKRCAFYWDMGLGKTFVGAEKLLSHKGKINIVICQKSKVDDWIEHFKTYYKIPVYDLTQKKILSNFCNTDISRVGIINYDLLHRRPELCELKELNILLDESSMIKNDTALRTRYCLAMNVESVTLLSGTPVNGKYEELYSQCKLLGWKISKKEFWERYINWTPLFMPNMQFPLKQVIGYKNVDELKNNLKQYGCIFLKSDSVQDYLVEHGYNPNEIKDELKLPEQNFIDVMVANTKEYKSFLKDKYISFVYEKEKIELWGDAPIKKLLYARQLAGVYNKNKLDALKDLIESTEDRLVIFYNFWSEFDAIKKICKDRPLSFANGKGTDLKAYNNKNNSITLIQYQSGSKGLNLQKCNKIVYFTPPLSSEDFEQSKKRIHRNGQTNTCSYFLMKVKGSVENHIYETLALRRDYTEALFI